MYGTSRKSTSEDRTYAVNLMEGGMSPQTVTQITGVNAHSLLALAGMRPVRREEYRPPVVPAPVVKAPLRFLPPQEPKRTTAAYVIREVAERHHLHPHDLTAGNARRRHSWPRHELMHRLHRELGLSTTVVGRLLGGRDHTTVIHGVRMHEARLAWIEALKGMCPR